MSVRLVQNFRGNVSETDYGTGSITLSRRPSLVSNTILENGGIPPRVGDISGDIPNSTTPNERFHSGANGYGLAGQQKIMEYKDKDSQLRTFLATQSESPNVIFYEFDIYPKRGVRDSFRIIIGGGYIFYTSDHYKNFLAKKTQSDNPIAGNFPFGDIEDLF